MSDIHGAPRRHGHGGKPVAARERSEAVVRPGDFAVAAVGLDHGHIYDMCRHLADAGAEIVAVFDSDAAKVERFLRLFPTARRAASMEAILDDRSVSMVASAAIPSRRGPLGLRVQRAGKHFFSDKAPFTTREQLAQARRCVKETGLIWAVCYSERVQNEAAVYAGSLIADGAIGRVVQVIGLGPHRLQADSRPEWFFRRADYGGILIDIGSHQIEQFLAFSGATSARVVHSQTANYAHAQYPEFDDFGDASLTADNGATGYFRVDWFTPDGLSSWGDARTFILGTEGYIELRKNVDVATGSADDGAPTNNTLILVDGRGEHRIPCTGTVGRPYFRRLILDCLNGTENAMSQEHTFRAAELCIEAQERATRLAPTGL